MEQGEHERRWLWLTLMLSCISIAALVFALWELIENRFFQHLDYVSLHYLYITRGIASSLLLAAWAAFYMLRQRRRAEEELRRSREYYRGLLEVLPGAVVLYDDALRVAEWNAASERLYGFPKNDVLNGRLPTVPPDRLEELDELRTRARHDEASELETVRCDRDGNRIEVHLSLLRFRETGGREYFLEVTSDIRERVRLQQQLLNLEKLTSMGKIAAGTAHHLNTPLAAMLLRVQMMRERGAGRAPGDGRPAASDLERLENGLQYCQHFVRRLLDFSRQAPVAKQADEIGTILESAASFVAPSLLAKRARLMVDFDGARGCRVFADRNHIETLFTILLCNAMDAIPDGGGVSIRCRRAGDAAIEVQVADDGPGIEPSVLSHIFEPFFTTKPPGKGTGLGLAIARNIVDEHRGSLRLESAPGRGTTAVVELPLYAAAGGEER